MRPPVVQLRWSLAITTDFFCIWVSIWDPYHILYFSLKLRTVQFFCRHSETAVFGHQHKHSKVHNSAPYQETFILNT